MTDNSGKILKSVRPGKIIMPIILGLLVTAFLFLREYEPGTFDAFSFTLFSVVWLLASFLMMVIRDLGYMWRIRILTDNDLSWRKAFNIIMLWEFTSAITPSAVGGTSVAIFYVNKEGIKLGRATGVVMVTSFLDELFFVIAFPLVVLLVGSGYLFEGSLMDGGWTGKLFLVALAGYALKFLYVLVISYGLFVNPRGLKWLLLLIFRWSFLRKWRPQAYEAGNELVVTSQHFKNWKFKSWINAFGATSISWIARYWVVNTLIIAFLGLSHLSLFEHFVVFAKQLIMWIMMLVSPTPGGTGFAELVFKEFLGGFIPAGGVIAMALMWRLVSYYPYLLIGAFVIPRWIKNHFIVRKK